SRRHTSSKRDWSSDVCSSDLAHALLVGARRAKLFESGSGEMGKLDTPRSLLHNEQMALSGQNAAPTAINPADQEPRFHGYVKPYKPLYLSRLYAIKCLKFQPRGFQYWKTRGVQKLLPAYQVHGVQRDVPVATIREIQIAKSYGT